jgi:hypothetical protein
MPELIIGTYLVSSAQVKLSRRTVSVMSVLGGPDPPAVADPNMGGDANVPPGAPAQTPGYLRTSWRTMRKVDSDAWRAVSRNAPFRSVRWFIIVGLVIWRWAAGDPSNAVGWWPVLFLAVVLVLPDTVGINLAGSGIQLRDVAEKAEEAQAAVVRLELSLKAGEGQGEAAAEAATAEAEPPAPAGEAAAEFLS